ncbi:MAG TPA: glycosyltransferase family 2 protein, partial [Smithellaceae bacterium]|nr:glycosyltransferase family 2 protein [Smithellaceae bacterium]
MISFVVIGLNEGWKLIKCLDAIYHAIKYNQINNYDVIYIDSNSADNSIEFAKKYIDVKIFRIIGECNPAIARNIGAKEAKGDILFFIDGDMEIQPEFLKKVINESGQLKYDCVTGHVDDLFYGTKKNIICRRPRTYKDKLHEKEQILEAAGGIFIIKKLHWQKVHGMKTKYRVNEDMDLTLRLSRHGIKTIRIP